MDTFKQIGAPGVLGVRILPPRNALTNYVFPEHNRIGSEMLCRLLHARMDLAGVKATETYHGFALNRAFYMFAVSEPCAALEAVKAELENLCLIEWAHIAWRDLQGDMWHVWHSNADGFKSPSDEEFADERGFLEATVNAAKKSQQTDYDPPSQ